MMPPAAYSRSQRRPPPRERARRRTLRRALPAMPVSRHECPFPSLARNAGPPRLFSLREQEPGPALVSLLLRTTSRSPGRDRCSSTKAVLSSVPLELALTARLDEEEQAGWVGYGPSLGAPGPPADGLAALLSLPGGLPDRLVSTVAAARSCGAVS